MLGAMSGWRWPIWRGRGGIGNRTRWDEDTGGLSAEVVMWEAFMKCRTWNRKNVEWVRRPWEKVDWVCGGFGEA